MKSKKPFYGCQNEHKGCPKTESDGGPGMCIRREGHQARYHKCKCGFRWPRRPTKAERELNRNIGLAMLQDTY